MADEHLASRLLVDLNAPPTEDEAGQTVFGRLWETMKTGGVAQGTAAQDVRRNLTGTTERFLEPLGELVQMDAGNFYADPQSGELMAPGPNDVIEQDQKTGKLMVYARRPSSETGGRVDRLGKVMIEGMAGSVLPRAGAAIDAARAPGLMRGSEKTAVQLAHERAANPNYARENLTNRIAEAGSPEGIERGKQAMGTATREGDRAGNINLQYLAQIEGEDDVGPILKKVAENNADFMVARRGVISNEELQGLAADTGMTVKSLVDRMKQGLLMPEEMYAARELMITSARRINVLKKAAIGGDSRAQGEMMKEFMRLASIQEHVSRGAAEYGRGLNQFKILARGNDEEINALVKLYKDKGFDEVLDTMRYLESPEEVANFVGNITKPTMGDKAVELYINGLLSGLQTFIVNPSSNLLTSMLGPASRVGTVASQKVARGITGVGDQASFREAAEQLFGLAEGVPDAWRAAVRAWKTEQGTGLYSKIDLKRQGTIGGRTGRAVRTPARILQSQDEFFKAINYRSKINQMAYHIAINEGESPEQVLNLIKQYKTNPTSGMIKKAKEFAEYQTFTNELGTAGAAIGKAVTHFRAARVLVPFYRTPTNIVKYSSDYIPITSVAKALFGAKKWKAEPHEMMGRLAVGTATTGFFAWQAAQGNIQGACGFTSKERAVRRKNGCVPYSYKGVSFSRLEPVSMIAGLTADVVQAFQRGFASYKDVEDMAALLAYSVAQNLTSKTWLESMSNFLDAFTDRGSLKAMNDWIGKTVASGIPTIIAQAARTKDPYLREAETVWENVLARIPGARETLPMKRDFIYGEPIEYGQLQPGESKFSKIVTSGVNFLNPFYFSADREDPFLTAMIDSGFLPGEPARQLFGVELTIDEFNYFKQSYGAFIKKHGPKITNSNTFKNGDNYVKRIMLDELFGLAHKAGAMMTVKKIGNEFAVRRKEAEQEKREQ